MGAGALVVMGTVYYKAGASVALIVAAALAIAMSGLTAHEDERAARDASQDCSTRYAALLDLAELARRDGKSSEVVVRGLSDRGGAMSGCLSAVGGARAR